MDELPQCELNDTTLGSYVHSPHIAITDLFTSLTVTASDTVVDIGCGDGRACFVAAEKFGATAVGIDCDLGLIDGMNKKIATKGLVGKVFGICGDGLESDSLLGPHHPVTIVYLYILAHKLFLLYPVLRQLFDRNPKLVVATAFVFMPSSPIGLGCAG